MVFHEVSYHAPFALPGRCERDLLEPGVPRQRWFRRRKERLFLALELVHVLPSSKFPGCFSIPPTTKCLALKHQNMKIITTITNITRLATCAISKWALLACVLCDPRGVVISIDICPRSSSGAQQLRFLCDSRRLHRATMHTSLPLFAFVLVAIGVCGVFLISDSEGVVREASVPPLPRKQQHAIPPLPPLKLPKLPRATTPQSKRLNLESAGLPPVERSTIEDEAFQAAQVKASSSVNSEDEGRLTADTQETTAAVVAKSANEYIKKHHLKAPNSPTCRALKCHYTLAKQCVVSIKMGCGGVGVDCDTPATPVC